MAGMFLQCDRRTPDVFWGCFIILFLIFFISHFLHFPRGSESCINKCIIGGTHQQGYTDQQQHGRNR